MAKISDLPLIDEYWTSQGQLYIPADLSTGLSRTTDQISAESLIEGYLANPTASDTHVINQETVYYCISNYLSEQFPSYPDAHGVNDYLSAYLSEYLPPYLSQYLSTTLPELLSTVVPPIVEDYLSNNLSTLIEPYLEDVVVEDDFHGVGYELAQTLSAMNYFYDHSDEEPDQYSLANVEFTTAWQIRMGAYLSDNSYAIYEAISQYLPS